jgi:hypothetical protein
VLRRKSSIFKGYSKLALEQLQSSIAGGADLDAIWEKHKDQFGRRKKK